MGYGFFQTRHSTDSAAEAHGGRELTLQGLLWRGVAVRVG